MSLLYAHDTLILDANCVISLYASKQMANILAAIPKTITIAAYVSENEALWVYSEPDESGQRTKEPILLQPLIDTGLLHIVTIQSEDEAEIFATFAAMIRDQGEAITGAIAFKRNWAIVVDDEKARRLFHQNASHLQLIYMLELVKHWVEVDSPPDEIITATLQNIRKRATYTPRNQHPLYKWWHSNGGS